eukprot:5962149-Pyramimonas_sp.AAC.1
MHGFGNRAPNPRIANPCLRAPEVGIPKAGSALCWPPGRAPPGVFGHRHWQRGLHAGETQQHRLKS